MCWGRNASGEVGNGLTGSPYIVPQQVSGLTSGVSTISMGTQFACASTSAGAAYCWGYNQAARLGNSSLTLGAKYYSPQPVTGFSSNTATIVAGSSTGCLLKSSDGAMLCWGDNASGAMDIGLTGGSYNAPYQSVNTSGIKSIGEGNLFGCALNTSGGVSCWGDNTDGEIGNGVTGGSYNSSQQVIGLTSGVKAISTGNYHSCAITSAGAVVCWGDNSYGALGNGVTGGSYNTPQQVTGLTSGFVSVSAKDSTIQILPIPLREHWGFYMPPCALP